MPTIKINQKYLWTLLGKELSKEEFDNVCFDFGLEVEFPDEDAGEDAEIGKDECKVEVPANRYDILSVEGLAINLGRFLELHPIPKFHYKEGSIKIKNDSSTENVRPVLVSAVLRGVTFTPENYKSFIDLQDKIHHNLGRRRTLVSIGTHDLATLTPPFIYKAQAPEDIKFVALNKTEATTAPELFEVLSQENHLKPFLKILEGQPLYPVIYDSENRVLSLPPIINGDHSKITLDTKDVFIEITATDLTKAKIALDIITTQFSLYTESKFTIESVQVENHDGSISVTPNIEPRTITADIDYINSINGLSLKKEEIVKLLGKMGLEHVGSDGDDGKITLSVPIYRSDVLHQCDVAEDLGIAYGYENIIPCPPPVATIGLQNELNKMTDLLRVEMCSAGYKECLNFALCSIEENTVALNSTETDKIVTISNAKTTYFQSGRISLIPGLLKTLSNNRHNKLPISFFEVQDVILRTDNEVGAKNERRIGCIRTANDSSELSEIHGTLDFIMTKLNVSHCATNGYTIIKSNHPTFFQNLQAEVLYKGKSIGHFGIVDIKILDHFGWKYPISALEINIENLVADFVESFKTK